VLLIGGREGGYLVTGVSSLFIFMKVNPVTFLQFIILLILILILLLFIPRKSRAQVRIVDTSNRNRVKLVVGEYTLRKRREAAKRRKRWIERQRRLQWDGVYSSPTSRAW